MDMIFHESKSGLGVSRQTRNLIQTIGQTKNKSTEEEIIRKEIEVVRRQVSVGCEPEECVDVLIKLIYFETLGYDTSFAHILPINLCQSPSLPLKKMAYLLAALLVKPGDHLCLLMHNTILKDLQSDNTFVVMTTLTMLRYFLSHSLLPALLPLLRKLTKHTVSVVRRKAYLVLLNVHQLFPSEAADIRHLAIQALSDGETPVMFAGVSLLYPLVMGEPHLFRGEAKRLAELLRNILDHKYPKEYDYHRIPAPWAQIELLRMLEAVGRNDQQASSSMYEVLEKTMRYCTNLSATMHFSKGILQQAIRTVCSVMSAPYLVEQAQQTVYKFFDYGNNNMKYFGIDCLQQLVRLHPQCLDRWHLMLLDCLDAPDITLADKTAALLTQIANPHNAQHILTKLLGLADRASEDTERSNLIKKALVLIERFSSDRECFLERMNEILFKFDYLISPASLNNFLRTLLDLADLDPPFLPAARTTYLHILRHLRTPALLRVAAWVVAEFTVRLHHAAPHQPLVDEAVDALIECGEAYLGESSVMVLLVGSLMKLAVKDMTSRHPQIKQFMLRVEASPNYLTHKAAEEFIRNAKYARALAQADALVPDHMPFLHNYAQQHPAPARTKYLISKTNLQHYELLQQEQQREELDEALAATRTNNVFEFKRGKYAQPEDSNRTEAHLEDSEYEVALPEKKALTLLGPRAGKKSKPVDQAKQKLANKLFTTRRQ